ncbi:DUF1538 domain-containing protein [Methylovulum miyakonense]|uniref:DUF1538 domain-containing protein n=1 Tax=Methylovulum miyakonense TaxID=645578 RepID=UPI000361E932|nr:DUF1538 domain-containing protein [Methylovulum miyakonense]
MLKNRFIKQLFSSLFDLLPILAVVLFFQIAIIRQPIPDVLHLVLGMLFVVLGLALFVQGLEQSLFPLGESLAYAFARKGSVVWLLVFAFCLGFGSAVAEPSLIAISNEAARIAGQGHIIADSELAKSDYALGLRLTIALAVGVAILVGVLRIIRGWPIYYPIIGGYVAVAAITPFAPKEIVGIAYDSGGVATTTITVPLVTALGVGLATAIKGRNPMSDGFGMIALAALLAMLFVMVYGIVR